MNIYKLTQKINTWYDTYDSIIVYAENEEEAKKISPNDWETPTKEQFFSARSWEFTTWGYKEAIEVEFLGIASDYNSSWIILASFNAW